MRRLSAVQGGGAGASAYSPAMAMLRTLLFMVLAVWAVVPGWSGDERRRELGRDARLVTTRVPLDPRAPARRRVGRLTFMGGVALTSPDPAFGGFSSLSVAGDRVTLLSDGGNIVRFRLRSDGVATDVAFGDLPDGPGSGWRKRDRDSESLAVDQRSGTAWVGFEDSNMIWRYAPELVRAERAAAPAAMRRWRSNGGAETLVRRRDGRFVAIAEDPVRGGDATRAGLLFAGDPTGTGRVARFRYVPPAGYSPSDATELADGRLLVLNRRLAWPGGFDAVLVMVAPGAIRAGARVSGTPVARLAAPLTHDNMEGVAATVEGGRQIIWLASDDNQTWPERSLLLKFRLD